MNTAEVLDCVLRELDAKRSVALAAVVATRGSTPQPAGVVVGIDHAANMTGTLGGGCVEADVRRQAHRLLTTGSGKLLTFELDQDFGYDDGMICGGQMDIAITVLPPETDPTPFDKARKRIRAGQDATVPLRTVRSGQPVEYRVHLEAQPKLLIAGAGHIARLLADMTTRLGFAVHVIDDRGDLLDQQRFPPPIERHMGDIAGTLSESAIDADTYIVIVTRGHKHDEACLRAVLESSAKYIGMIGSRRKVRVIFDDLKRAGATDEQLQRVHAPIGLSVGAVTTEEIAVSITAQLISIRRAKRQESVAGPFPIPPVDS